MRGVMLLMCLADARAELSRAHGGVQPYRSWTCFGAAAEENQ
jgi:hypothetical protein